MVAVPDQRARRPSEATAPDERTRERLRAALMAIPPLPALDGTVRRVLALLDEPEAGTAEVAAAIEKDEAFSADVLRAAGAAAAGRRHPVAGVGQAVAFLGREGVRRLALEVATFRLLERVPGGGAATRAELHGHAVAVAAWAAALADRAGADARAAHLGGLLHDVGKLVMPGIFPPEALEAIAAEAPCGGARSAREREAFGIDHAAVGAALGETWGLDPDVVAAVRDHHGPRAGGRVGRCVQAANAVARLLAGHDADHGLLARALAELGLERPVLEEVAEELSGGDSPEPDRARARMRELERIAAHDDLTGIASRRHWAEAVAAALARGVAGAVLLCDVDDFKRVNDEAGHQAGDRVLVATAGVLDRAGFAGRIGGDEFAVWIEGATADEGRSAGERICRSIVEATALILERSPVGASVGVARAPDDGRGLDELLAAADAALYAAKGAGKGRARRASATGPEASGPPGNGAAARPAAGGTLTASAVVRAMLGGIRAAGGVAERAQDPGVGDRAAAAVDRAIERLCRSDRSVALIVEHAMAPGLLAHGMETAALACVIAAHLGHSDDALEQLATAGLFADIGMGAIDRRLVARPGPLDDRGQALVRRHPRLGAELLERIGAEWPLAPVVALQHHERWDGAGYPEALRGERIRPEAQLVALGHRYLAAVRPRAHRPALPPHEALELLFTLGGGLADAPLVRAFVEAIAVYPVGSLVRLSEGTGGEVVRGGPPARPSVRLLWGPDGAPLVPASGVRLAERPTVFIEAYGF